MHHFRSLLALVPLALVAAEAFAAPPRAKHGSDDAGFYIPGDELVPTTSTRRRARRNVRPWYQPRIAVGGGLNLPELVPLEGWAFFGRHFALRTFYVPEIPFNIRIEMPADVISSKKGIGVANPDFEIKFRARYGPQYGLEALAFPFGGSFFVGAGASYRRMRLVGSTQSQILICSLEEARQEPPCGDPNASLRPDTVLKVNADVETTAILGRFALGWFWDVGDWGYVTTTAGLTKPTAVKRRVDVVASLDSPSGDDDDITGALAQVKAEREADLESKAVKEMRPVDEKVLPILGLSAGIRF